MQIEAVLWDGYKRISGFLEVQDNYVDFKFSDFDKSSLSLHIPMHQIHSIKPYHLYSQPPNGIQIIGADNTHNVFIIDKEIIQKTVTTINQLKLKFNKL